MERLSREKSLTKEHFLRRFLKHFLKSIKELNPNQPEKFRKGDFVEFRCLKLDQRGRGILGETTYPDNGKLFIREKKNLLCEFEPLKLNSSLKKRKDAINKTRLYYFCRMLKRAFPKEIDRSECFTLHYDNCFDGKNSKEEYRPFLAYLMIGVLTREQSFHQVLKRSLAKQILMEALIYFCGKGELLWEMMVFGFEEWLRFFQNTEELHNIIQSKYLNLHQNLFGQTSLQILVETLFSC